MKKTTTPDGWVKIEQDDAPVLGYSPKSKVKLIERDGLIFKSFDGSDTLLPYEDWRLSPMRRAQDLASRLSIDQIAGLMLYSPQYHIPARTGTFDGKPFDVAVKKSWELSDQQKEILAQDNVRHILVAGVESPEAAARWNNRVQAFVENLGFGIPANNSSDPRHSSFFDEQFGSGSKGRTSLWSHCLGLAATFSPERVERFARIASAEYRAMGLTTALSPQCDLGTDPRWYRYSSTFGNDPDLVTDLTRAYVKGFQETGQKGWGTESVNAMAKHWPGGGSGEGGRDAHYGNGKYAVYPGGAYRQHKKPFVDGAFRLDSLTEKASAVMPYYTISHGIDPAGERGNAFSVEIITNQLRRDAGFDGVVCTDWAITHDEIHPGVHSGKPWGVENETEAGRHYLALKAGVDQFGGNQAKEPVIEAYEMGVAEFGEKAMRERMEQSAIRLLLNMFRTGLFENPYTDPENTRKVVGNPVWVAEGREQQLDSVIMLKNSKRVLPLNDGVKVWIPGRHVPETLTYWRSIIPARDIDPVKDVEYNGFTRVDTPTDADAAIVFIESPHSYMMGYDTEDANNGGNGYIPISLQYRPYTATASRRVSLAGGDPYEPDTNRSYLGKSCTTINECDLDLVEDVRRQMKGKPVIVIMQTSNPPVLSEIEPLADALIMGFDVHPSVYLDIIMGRHNPSALLPFELPASMDDIERHAEDKPHDIRPYTDVDGNIYTFGFGLSFNGRIHDHRTIRYVDNL